MASMDDGDVTQNSPPFSPHALQLRAIPVPFWGVPAHTPVAAANHATMAVPVEQLANDTTAAGIFATATAAAPASTAAAPATSAASLITTATVTTAAGGATTAMLADQDPTARMLVFTDAEEAAAPAPEPTDVPMDDGEVAPTSPPPFSPHALQLRAIPVPFWGVPAPVPVAAPKDHATAAVAVIKQLTTDTTAAGTFATATAAAPASTAAAAASAPTAAAPATAAASLVTTATATTAVGGVTMALLADRCPTARMLDFADAEQAAAAAPEPADAPGTSSIRSAGGAVSIRRRLDGTAGSAARPPAAGKTFIRGGRGSLPAGTPLLSTGRRPSLGSSKSCMVPNSNFHCHRDTTNSKETSCSDSNKESRLGSGKARTPATSSLQVIQQQPLASRALLQLTPCSPTARTSPSAAMSDGDETPSSPGFSPHALHLCAIPVPFWGLTAAVPLAAANSCATAEGTLGSAMPAATAPASAAPPATAAVLPEQASTARTVQSLDAEQAAAPAASVEPSQACLAKPYAERQHNPLPSCDINGAASTPFQAPASSATTSSQNIISDNDAEHSSPRPAMAAGSPDTPLAAGDLSPESPGFSPHALQLHAISVPFWGEPAALPLAAANNIAIAAGTAASAMAAAAAPAAVPAPPATSVPAAIVTASVSAAPATATTADPSPAARVWHLTDAERVAAPAATAEPSQAYVLNAHAEKQHCAQSSIADISGAVTAKENQPRGSRRRTASVAAPAASRIVPRSQAAAQKHVQRIRMRTQRKS